MIRLDVKNHVSINKAVKTIQNKRGRLDVLVNNAGIALTGFFEDTSSAEMREVFATNVFGLATLTKAVLPIMRRQKRATIINISSIAGVFGKPVSGLSQALHYELHPLGIRVVNVCPGIFKTNLIKEDMNLVRMAQDPRSPYYKATQKFRGIAQKMTSMAGDPERVALLVAKIACTNNPKSRYIIGREAIIEMILRKIIPLKLADFLTYIVTRKMFGNNFNKDMLPEEHLPKKWMGHPFLIYRGHVVAAKQAISKLVREIRDVVKKYPVERGNIFLVGLNEVIANIAEHALKFRKKEKIHIFIYFENDKYAAVLEDTSQSFDPLKKKSNSPKKQFEEGADGGYGMYMFKNAFTRIKYFPGKSKNTTVLLFDPSKVKLSGS